MDILRFVNSKDVRNHLQKIGYQFSPLEAAWLICQCKDAALKEKHKAWNELTETMPDCSIPGRRNTVAQDSLHAFLKKYVELEEKLELEFYGKRTDTPDSGRPFVYKFEYVCQNGTEYDRGTVFSRFDALFDEAPEEDVVSVRCTKMQIDRKDGLQTAYFTPSFELMAINPGRFENEEEEKIYYGVFDGLWFDFPTPFKTGDIVRFKSFHGGPFVITGVCPDCIESERVKDNVRKNGDTTDMCAYGYFANADGGIYKDCTDNYMDVEFYTEELTGAMRTLIPLSTFLKGKIDAGLYARAYHQIMTEGYSDGCKPIGHLRSELVLAGLEKEVHLKIWLDDVREAPEGYFHCKSVNEAKKKIVECEREGTVIDVIDCDHDLGDHANDGGDGIKLLDWLVERKTFYPICLHTMNPVGRENMRREIERYWDAK